MFLRFTFLQIQMNNELEWQKVIEWDQQQNTYLIHIITTQTQISIEVQDKWNGDTWHSNYPSERIEELTHKTGHAKKYAVFVKMLISALTKTSDSLTVEIFSYREMNSKFGKPGLQSKAITPEQASKRFLLLTYVGEFEKMTFPLPLLAENYERNDSGEGIDRLKLTIKRMGQLLKMLRQGESQSELLNENSLLKYENETLRSKLKNSTKLDSSSFLQPKVEEMELQLSTRQSQVLNLQTKLTESENLRLQSEKKLKEKQTKIIELQSLIEQYEADRGDKVKSKKKLTFYQQKIEQMIGQMDDLSSELAHHREREKKYELKINTLQKELQKMIANKKVQPRNTVGLSHDSSPDDKKSQRSVSVKSGRSNTSKKSLNRTKNNLNRKPFNDYGQPSKLTLSNSKKIGQQRKSSVYDSDTESSKMRKMATGRSPYRQTVNPINSKNSRPQRSRSKSRERVNSPKPSNVTQSQMMMTQGYQSESSQDPEFDRIDGYLKTLKQRKGAANNVKPKASNPSGTKIQKRLQTLQEMIRKTALATRSKQ